ncbi:hypothetical protein [Staphylococcus coagulans]|uniref:hypothetical protein n=1 Tax=Staphylococcus coagulans TaxID=74706 RepID=UPI001F3D2515|nr:hypothetical protein [Staphylococcus coagulans]MDU9268166.1 hypothetical protein [Staphylococcus coagulans]MDU9280108.1 hypothetical protein [Staphylococcus coagulans]MDU9292151.1 hypothetical protein [Staphylococcus coagulans]MDU9304533.1 hypothetical protein [Staphylococcus coagulans]MDU9321532.1 hypothetical protein [Staphylococcus coagulans]
MNRDHHVVNNDLNIRFYHYLADLNTSQFDDPTMVDAEVNEMMVAVHQMVEAELVAKAF